MNKEIKLYLEKNKKKLSAQQKKNVKKWIVNFYWKVVKVVIITNLRKWFAQAIKNLFFTPTHNNIE